MDVSRFRVGDWVLIAAGAAMLVLGLAVPWATVEFRGVELDGARNAFNYPLTGGLAWLLVVAAGVVTFLRAGRLITDGKLAWTRLTVVGTALAVLLMLLRLLVGAGDDARATLGRGPGMIVAVVASSAALAGAVLNHRAEGGSLPDLWSFGSQGRSPRARRSPTLPPPPPGTATRGEDAPPPPA